ncbi:MAG: substrate-binding domain-containing protein [Eubacteriales bacterium]|nr:substrate-binding domain-containing protein [Eubacteriales bacterium]
MKKTRFLTLLFIVFVLCAMISAIDLYTESEPKSSSDTAVRNYVYLSPNKEESFWCSIALGIREADLAGGTDTLLVEYGDNNSNIPEYFRDASLSGPDGIIMKGADNADEQIQNAVSAGIPVIFYNSDFPSSNRTCYIGIDNYKAGLQAAETLLDISGQKGKILLIVRSKTASSQIDRIKGIQDKLKEFPDMEIADIIEDNGNLLELKEKLLLVEKENPDIQAIISMEGIASDNIGDLLYGGQRKNDDLRIIVFDFTEKTEEYLRNGCYDAIIMQDTRQIGFQAVSALNKYYETKDETGTGSIEDVIYLDTICITKNNIEEYVQEDDWQTLEWNSY